MTEKTKDAVNWNAVAARMRSDPILWMEACLKIRDRTGKLVPFRLNPFQKKLVNEVMGRLENGRRAFFVILKGRQLGISTVCRGLMLWRALNFQGQQCVVAAHEVGLTKQSLTLMREMLESLPGAFGYPEPEISSDTRVMWRRSGSTVMQRLPAGKSEGRGLPVHFLHCTEADFFDTLQAGCWERFLGGVLPALPQRGSIFIVESTCQGRKALWDLYTKSMGPNSEWGHLFFPWFEEPQYRTDTRHELTEMELEQQKRHGLDDDQINFWAGFSREVGTLTALREYPFCIEDAFSVAGSNGLLTPDAIERAMGRQLWPLQEREPVILGVDPSRLRDSTGIAVRQGKNMVSVSEIPPLGNVYDLAELVVSIVRDYRVDIINCDSGGLGSAFIDVLQKMVQRFVNAVDFGSKAKDEGKFFNRRAEMYDALRKWLAADGKLPGCPALANELLAIEINTRKEGRLLLEPKHRLKKSPNMADACALTMTAESYFSQARHLPSITIKSSL
jgi:hypothetical protein